jgi:hypothetical protein
MNGASVKGLFIFFHCLLAEPWTPTRYHLAVNDPSDVQPDLSSLLVSAASLPPYEYTSLIPLITAIGGDLGTLLSAVLDNSRFPPHRFRSLTSWWIRWGGTRMHKLQSLSRDAVDSEFPMAYPIPDRYLKGVRSYHCCWCLLSSSCPLCFSNASNSDPIVPLSQD